MWVRSLQLAVGFNWAVWADEILFSHSRVDVKRTFTRRKTESGHHAESLSGGGNIPPAGRSAQQEIIELKYSAGTLSSSDNPSQMGQKDYIENGVMCWTAAQGIQIALEELFRTRGMKSITSMRILLKKVMSWRDTEAWSARWIAMHWRLGLKRHN
jgi:hypothetical protein